MTDNKKNPVTAATVSRARESAKDQKPHSINKNTISNTENQVLFVECFLRHGEANAITSKDLLKMTGFRSIRELQAEIERERNNGALILSKAHGGGGYFLPDEGEAGKTEIERFIATVSARARHSFRSLKAARRALNEYKR